MKLRNSETDLTILGFPVFGFRYVYVLVFLATALLAAGLRTQFELLPDLKAHFALLARDNLAEYAYLQARQASSDRGRKALLVYVNELYGIRSRIKKYPQQSLHFDIGATELRLYRLESVAGNLTEASVHMARAQAEFVALGWKDTSQAYLAGLIEEREANEARLFGVSAPPPAAGAQKEGCDSRGQRR